MVPLYLHMMPMNELEYFARSAALNGYAEASIGLGVDPFAMLSELGLPAACLSEPDLLIPTQSVLELFERTSAKTGVLDLGLRISEARKFSTMGAVGLLMREQPTLRSAIGVVSENLWIHVGGVSIAIEESLDLSLLMPLIAPQAGGPRRQAIELMAAMTVKIIRRFLPTNWQPEMISFAHSRPRDLALHIKVFGQAPIFESDRNAVVIKKRDLDTKILEADPVNAGELRRYLQFIAGERNDRFVVRVEKVVSILLPRGECRIDEVAIFFGVSRRTLQRRLEEDGTSFEKVVQGARAKLARTYLGSNDLSMTAISQLLGFSCLSAFSRWKKTNAQSING